MSCLSIWCARVHARTQPHRQDAPKLMSCLTIYKKRKRGKQLPQIWCHACLWKIPSSMPLLLWPPLAPVCMCVYVCVSLREGWAEWKGGRETERWRLGRGAGRVCDRPSVGSVLLNPLLRTRRRAHTDIDTDRQIHTRTDIHRHAYTQRYAQTERGREGGRERERGERASARARAQARERERATYIHRERESAQYIYIYKH